MLLKNHEEKKGWKKCRASQFCSKRLGDCVCCITSLCTQNKLVQVSIVSHLTNYYIKRFAAIRKVEDHIKLIRNRSWQVTHKKHVKGTHVSEIESLFLKWQKNETMVEFLIASLHNSKAMYDLCFILRNTIVLFAWKYQLSLYLAFSIERSRNFWIFAWSAKSRGGRGYSFNGQSPLC